MEESVSEKLYHAVLNRMNITWQPDQSTDMNIRNAMEEAADYLRKVAGSPGLSFEDGELRNLFISCAWYFVENKRADFREDYKDELIALRLEEGFGCGKGETES